MFFKKSHSANEIEASVLESLPQSEEANIEVALQSLADSAEIFEAMNLPDEAEVITQFMETIASGQFAMVKEAKKKAKKKSKTKSKSKSKSKLKKMDKPSAIVEIIENGATEGLTSDKEVENLANIGWVFNAPKGDCGECSMADDGPESGTHKMESANDNDTPLAYDKCSECGFDHAHEPEEAFDAHFPSKLESEKEDEYLLNSVDM